MNIKEFLKLTRFEHAIMLAIAVLIGEVIVLGGFPSLELILVFSLLVPILSEMGSFSLNDYLDMDADKLNKRKDRPLVNGTIDPKLAFQLGWVFLVLSTIIAFFINSTAFIIALIFNLLAIGYNYKLKDLPLVGNIYIGLSMAIPFIFGNFIYSTEINPLVFLLAFLAFLVGLSREILKSIQDMDGDLKARGSKTFPILFGKKESLLITSILFIIFIISSFGLFLYFNNIISKILIFAADLGILFISFNLIKGRSDSLFLEQSRKITLYALFLGLVAILFGIIFGTI